MYYLFKCSNNFIFICLMVTVYLLILIIILIINYKIINN